MATVQNVIDQIAWAADLPSGTGKRLDPAALIPEIDAAYKIAWEMFIEAYDDYFVKRISGISITGGVGLNSYQIVAADFFKLKSVQRLIGTTYGSPLPTHEPNEAGAVDELSYRLEDDTIYFEPELGCNGTYQIKYVYTPADLTATGDPIAKDPNGMIRRFIVDYVGVRVKDREEDDPTTLKVLRDEMMLRIRRMASHRNAGRPRKIADTRRVRGFRFMTRSGIHLPS